MFTNKLKSVFAIAVGPGREQTFERFRFLAKKYAPDVDIEVYFDKKGEGCGTSRSRLFHKLKNKYDIVISVDDDIEITAGWYNKIVKAYLKFPKINMFTTKIIQDDSVYTSGVKMLIDGNVVTMVHNTYVDDEYIEMDFAPGGCMIFCREALKKLNPIPIPICEDYEWYGQWLKLNLGKVVAINNAILIHNVKDNPRVEGFRNVKNILDSCKLIYERHGWTFISEENIPKYYKNLTTDEEEIRMFVEEVSKMITDKRVATNYKKYNKVVIWGHLLHSHTCSYVHNGFFKAFKSLGYETYWLDNTEESHNIADKLGEVIYFTEGQVDSFMPIKDDCAYITHNCQPEKYGKVRRLGIQVMTTKNELLSKIEKISPLTYYDKDGRTLYFPWATDLLPEEFDFENVLKIPKENKIYWVGTIAPVGPFENVSEINPFKEDCLKNGIIFERLTGVSPEDNINFIKRSYISPCIVGKWQKQVGFIPCRMFKNISYGELGITNSEEIKKVFGDMVVYEPDTSKVIETVGNERFNKERIIKAMKYIQQYHTYINRVNDIIKVL